MSVKSSIPVNLAMTSSGTILPIIPPPAPADANPSNAPKKATRPAGVPTKVWKDTRGYHRMPTPMHKDNMGK